MYPSNLVEQPSRTAFGRLTAAALRLKGRVVHSSGADGIYVKARQPGRLHQLELTFYPVDSMRGPLLPRLKVNRGSFGIPRTLLKKWGIPPYGDPFQRDVGLEITFLTNEADTIASWLPTLMETLEDDESVEWAKGFPFDVHKTSPTNLWTKGANEFSNECVRANGALNARKGNEG